MKQRKIRSGSIADRISGFFDWMSSDESKPYDRVRHKMLYPRRRMSRDAQLILKREIQERLFFEYGITPNKYGKYRKPKPRVRYKLRRCYHWDSKQHKYIGVYQCIVAAVLSLFFLSSTPAEATNGHNTSLVSIVYISGAGSRGPVHSRFAMPMAIKSPSAFSIGSAPIKYVVDFPKVPAGVNYFIYQAYMQMADNQVRYNAMLAAPKPEKKSSWKFWTLLSGTVIAAFALIFSFNPVWWR